VASGERFDAITRLFGGTMSRRQAMKLAVGGALGTVGLVALQQKTANAACSSQTCIAPNFCCPDTPFGAGTCAPPTFPQCCGTTSCAAAPAQQCCPGTNPFAPFNQIVPPFCATGTPAQIQCCGNIACVVGPSFCAAGPNNTTCCLPAAAPAGSTCCGNLPFGCPPGKTCTQYPVGVFTCTSPVVSDRNVKEHVVPVAW
jgi:hypothetical protein